MINIWYIFERKEIIWRREKISDINKIITKSINIIVTDGSILLLEIFVDFRSKIVKIIEKSKF